MERKRELTSVDLAALVPELRTHLGARVEKVYLYGDSLVRLRMRDSAAGRLELLVEVGEQKRAHLVDPTHVSDAPERPPDFAMQLRNRLADARLAAVDQHGFDRVLRIAFERDGATVLLIAELFGEGNVVVTNADAEVLQCLRTVRLKSRTVAPGGQYAYPEARFDPTAVDREAFIARMRESDADLVRTLATRLTFGGLWAEELCTRAGVEKTRAVEAADDETLRTLYAAVDELVENQAAGTLDPRVYYERTDGGRRPVDATPFVLAEYDHLDGEPAETFGHALDTYFAAVESDAEEAGRDRPDFAAEIAKHERIIEQQETAIEEFAAEAAAERRRAERLYEHYDVVDEILETVRAAREEGRSWAEIRATLEAGRAQGIPAAERVVDIDAETGTVTVALDDERVPLDPSLGVERNADRRYQAAKEIEDKQAGAEAAVADTRADLAAVRERREEWERGDDDPQPASEPTEPTDWLTASSIPVRRTEQWYERFRWFHTGDGFLVVGGRNADQNEELVKKYMEPGDRFLHASAHGGPVTVLKATGPSEPTRDVDLPDRTLREAAQFAVSYASVWGDGRHTADAYAVAPDQVSKTPESGEYLEKGGFAVRGERTYYRDVAVGVAVGIQCEPETRVLGGPPAAIDGRVATSVALEPGRFAQNDIAKRIYRTFRDRFADTSFVRKVASPDEIQKFLPPGGSRMQES